MTLMNTSRHCPPDGPKHSPHSGTEDTGHSAEALLHELQVHQAELQMQNEELRRTQLALEESRNRYIDLYDFAPVGYLTLTVAGAIAEANLTATALLAVTREELLERSFESFLAADTLSHWRQQQLDALDVDHKVTSEVTFAPAAGRIAQGRIDCLRVTSADGTTMLRVALMDVTERTRAQDDLRKHGLAVAQSPDSIVITDLAGRIEYVNPAFTLVSGYSEAEVLGRNPRLLQSGRTPPQTYTELWATLGAGKVWRGEFVNRRKDGTEYLETATISPLRQPDGRVTHYVAVKTDITELKQTIAKLRTSENRLRLAQMATGLGIFDRDVASGRLEWDSRARELWGVGLDDPVTFDTFMAGLHPDDQAKVQAAIDRSLDPRSDGTYEIEYRVVSRTDGKVRHVRAIGQVFSEDGRPVRFIGTMKDVTAQKQLEQQLREQRSEMELLVNQQVAAQTAAAIAHELNQPLVSVSAYSEAALRLLRSGGGPSDKLTRSLEGSVEQAHRAGQKLHELLDFLHKGDAGAEPLDLNQLVRDALIIAENGGYGGFHAVVELEPELRPVVANQLHVQKVLVNLLHNGVQAMRSAGVAEAAIIIRVKTAAERHLAQVTVQDSGPGLDAATVDRIFEPFFTTKPQGIGLGLAISRALIEAHGGQLWADPAAGPGATFHLTLPFAS